MLRNGMWCKSYAMLCNVMQCNFTARPWCLPGLPTSVRASQDDDDDDDDVIDIFLETLQETLTTAWLTVPCGRGLWYLLETLQETPMTVWLTVPWGRGIWISFWNPIRSPNSWMVNSIGYVEATCSGYMICRSNMFWLTPSNTTEHKILPVVWRRTEFPGFTLFWAWANLEVCVHCYVMLCNVT